MPCSRRSFARSAGVALAATIGVGTAGEAAAATDYRSTIPDNVYLVYDEAELQTVEPYLDLSTLDVLPSRAASIIATTGDESLSTTGARETNIAMYWLEYPVQTGVTPWDSHLGDHEPVYVEYAPTANGPDIRRVIYSGYHWLRARSAAYPTAEDDLGDEHPALHVANPYHHYAIDGTASGSPPSQSAGLSDLRDHLQGWLDNGWPVHIPAITDPWTMKYRESWWRRGTFGVSAAESFYQAAEPTGLFSGGIDTDL